MAKDFEYKEIRTLLSDEKSYLEKETRFANEYSTLKQTVRTLLNSEEGKKICADFIRDEAVFDHGNVVYETEELSQLMKKIYQILLLKQGYAKAGASLSAKEKINEAMKKASSASGFLRWTFAGRSSQNEAQNAIAYLNSAEVSAFNQSADELERILKNNEKVSVSDAWEAFDTSKNPFINLLFKEKELGYISGSAVKEFEEVNGKYTDLKSAYTSLRSLMRPKRDQIRKAVNSFRSEEALRILENMSVDEMAKEHPGIRYKALKDGGYADVASVYNAIEADLSGLRGISEESAASLKEISTEIYHSTVETVKPRLSADRRTPAATELVQAVYAYQQFRTKFNEAKAWWSKHHNETEDASKYLNQINASIRWIFYSGQIKDQTARSYRLLKDALSSKECDAVKKLNEDLSRQIKITPEAAWADFTNQPIVYTNILEELIPQLFAQDPYYGIPEELAKEIQDEAYFPNGLLCELRRYQEWGVKYTLHQKKVLLGDEMGLGKTIQSIATMVSLRNTGAKRFMVVCPASVVTNWCREISSKSKLTVKKIHGSSRDKMYESWKQYGGVAVTTFETTGNFVMEDDFHFDMLIVDEAHYIKNENARRSQNVRNIAAHTDRILFLTGTAIENNVNEMISLINVLNPKIAASLENVSMLSAASRFREAIAPVYYRRKREDVLGELPELIENEEWISLNETERDLYNDSVLAQKYADIRQVSWNVDDVNESSKAERLVELVNEAESEGRKVIVFSFFLNTLKKVREALGERCVNTINGSVPVAKRQEIIDEFDKAAPGAVLPAQIQSGGTGLNIQSASVVIMCEPQLKPSIEKQAIARAYRMGQARNVLVYRLLCEDTLEERIMDRLSQKQLIFDAFADHSVAAEKSQEIDDQTFGSLIQAEIDHINAEKQKMS